MLQADPLHDREIPFAYEGNRYTARFRRQSGWMIFNAKGIICPEHQLPELWHFFRNHHEPDETKAINFLNNLQ